MGFLLVAGACSSGGSEGATEESLPPTTNDTTGGGGWIDGSPADAAASYSGGDEADGDMAMAESTTTRAAEDGGAVGGDEASLTMEEPGDSGPPRAGSIDDNASFDDYLAYLDRIADLEIPVRALDVSEQHRVQVVGSNDLPVAGAVVEVVQNGSVLGTVRTGADGVALVHPSAMPGRSDGEPLVMRVEGTEMALESASIGSTSIELDRPGGVDGAIALDVLFLIDATGSMGDEIDRLKTTVDEVAQRATELDVPIDLRLALTVYRDEGDAYVTRTFDFTGNVGDFQAALADVVADGGGDYPEALDEALADALDKPEWRDPATTVQLMFLLADAPPQVGRQVDQPYDASVRFAAERGIRIFPIASSDSDDQAEYVFRQLAQFTGARFVFLSYGVGGAAVGESSDIESVDYEELPLEDLLVRLIAEELSDLGGGDIEIPTPSTTSTTVDQ